MFKLVVPDTWLAGSMLPGALKFLVASENALKVNI